VAGAGNARRTGLVLRSQTVHLQSLYRATRGTQPCAAGEWSFNGLPGEMNIHFTVKAAAVDTASEAK
jgi:hypothetical protein